MKNEDKSIRQRVWKSFFTYFFYGVFGNYLLEANKYSEKQSNRSSWLDKVYTELKYLIKIEKIPIHWIDSFYRAITSGKVKLPFHEGAGLFINGKQLLREDELKDIKNAETIDLQITSKISKSELIRFIDDNWEVIQKLQSQLDLPKLTYSKTDFHSENFISYLLKEHTGTPMKQILQEMQESADQTTGHLVLRNTLDKAFKKYRQLEKDMDTS